MYRLSLLLTPGHALLTFPPPILAAIEDMPLAASR
jgi:hypothetical protein